MQIAGIGRQQVRMEICPHGSFPIQWTFDVVDLERNHFSDPHNEINQTFTGGPVIADADRGRFNIRMENRREHFALRTLTRVLPGQLNLDAMTIRRNRSPLRIPDQPAHMILHLVSLWRIPDNLKHLNGGEIAKGGLHLSGLRCEPSLSKRQVPRGCSRMF